MAIDYRSELRRPLPFSLAVIAAVLLIWLVVASIAGARQRTARDHRIQDLETQQTSLRGELDSQRQATGTLAALKYKDPCGRRRRVSKRRRPVSRLGRRLQVLPRSSRRRSAKRARRRQPSRRGPNAWAMCKLKSARPSRSLLRCVTLSSLPSKRRRLEPRNWPTSVVAWRRRVSRKPSFGLIIAALSQEATNKTTDLAKAEESQQKAREGSAAAQKELSDARRQAAETIKQRADLEQAILSLNANREKLGTEVAQVEQNLQQAKDSLATTRKDFANAQSERDRVITERTQAEQTVQKLSVDRESAMGATEALQKRQADAQAQLASLTETMAARNKRDGQP